MTDNTAIEWADATWNPLVGCTKVSPGCDHCYAETLVNRFAGSNAGFPNRFDVVTLRGEKMLTQPLRWREPRRVFVNSLSDLFHADVPDEFIAEVWAVMSLAPRHTFQLLTKRHARLRSLTSSFRFRIMVNSARLRRGYSVLPDSPPRGPSWPLRNVWLGVSVENQQWADVRIPALLDTPAAVRFLSCEPLLGPVWLRSEWLHSDQCFMRSGGPLCACCPGDARVDWVIVGGESGRDARPMQPGWAQSLRDQCVGAGVPFLFKQWGEHAPANQLSAEGLARAERMVQTCIGPEDAHYILRVGKKAAGRLLDGRTWDEFPEVMAG